jgi:acyl-CoA synthetase (AMP-forming)/AMP-acid ligase II
MFLDGQIYITGRLKDLLVIRGRNIHPQDVEQAAQAVDAQMRPGRGVAVPMKTEDGEGVVLIQEINARGRLGMEKLAQMAREAVLTSQQVSLAAIYFVPPHAVRRTTSGKLRRRATQAALEAGEIKVLHQDLELAQGLVERTSI